MLLRLPKTSRGPTTPVPRTPLAMTSASSAGTNSENISWRPVADQVILFYDPPFTLPFLRRTEAAVRVERSGEAGP